MAVTVTLKWEWIQWQTGYKWNKNVVPQLKDKGIKVDELKRCVYVIKSKTFFTVDYPNGISPTLYIGSGNFKTRLSNHDKWLTKLTELTETVSYSIGVCIPRVQKNSNAYKDCEAALLAKFEENYGCLPLMNQRGCKRKCNYIYPEDAMRQAINIGKGNRYLWAIRPLKSNKFKRIFESR